MIILTSALRAATLGVLLSTVAVPVLASEMPNEAKTSVCTLQYTDVKTDSGDMASWTTSFSGRIESQVKLGYRTVVLAPGKYDVWLESAKKPGHYYFCMGTKADAEKPSLRALFKLYEEEESVDKLSVELKEVRKGTKVKFSIRGGASEGHGNLRVIADEPPTD